MKNDRTWVLVADGARAQIFLNNGPGSGLEPALPQALVSDNRPSGDITSDRPGRTYNRVGKGRHSIQAGTDPHEYQQQLFAHDIAEVLDKKHEQNQYDKLIIIAAPKMLGALRHALGPVITRLIIAEVDKDLTKSKPDQLASQVGEIINL